MKVIKTRLTVRLMLSPQAIKIGNVAREMVMKIDVSYDVTSVVPELVVVIVVVLIHCAPLLWVVGTKL